MGVYVGREVGKRRGGVVDDDAGHHEEKESIFLKNLTTSCRSVCDRTSLIMLSPVLSFDSTQFRQKSNRNSELSTSFSFLPAEHGELL
jgi:hypothetical protein